MYRLVKIAIEVHSAKGEKLAPTSAGKGGSKSDEVLSLEEELRRKDKTIEALKKQSEGLSREYDRVCDELNKGSAKTSNKKDD